MMARRSRGEGGATQRHDHKTCPPAVKVTGEDGKTRCIRPEHVCRGRWQGTVITGWSGNSKTGRQTATVYGTSHAACIRKIALAKKALAEHGAAITSARTTVAQWAETWLTIHAGEVRAHTLACDASEVKRWIVPVLGRKRLETLTPADVRALATAVTEAGNTATTAHRAHSVLMKMLKDATLEGHRIPARLRDVKGPALSPTDRNTIPLDDALRILRAADARPDGSRWAAAFLQGVRQGEALGLTWPEVDLGTRLMTIRWQLDALPYRDRRAGTFKVNAHQSVRHLSGAWHLVEVKSAAGVRVLPIVAGLADSLAEWREIAPASPHGLVWPRKDGTPRSDREDRQQWHNLQDEAGVRHVSGRYYGVHEIRHVAATLLRMAGAPDEVIVSILGHSTILSSSPYIHTDAATQLAALEGIAGRLGLGAIEG